MKKILKTWLALVMIITFTGSAYSQETKKKIIKVDKEVEIENGKKIVTFTITREEDGTITIKDTTFDATNGYDEHAILKSLGVDAPDSNFQKVIIKKVEFMDSTVKGLEVMNEKLMMEGEDMKIFLDSNIDIEINHIVDGIEVDSFITTDKKVIVMVRVKIDDLTEAEYEKMVDDNIISKKAKLINDTDVVVYPNPSSGKLMVEFNLETKGNTLIKIHDAEGKQVYVEEQKDFTGEYKKEINIAGKKGVYFLTVTQGKQVITKKIVLQ